MLTALDAALDPAADRPVLRGDAEVGTRTTRWGERDAIVHAPATPYFRLQGAEVDLVMRLDGSVTVGTLASEALEAGLALSFDDVIALVADLHTAGLLARRPYDAYAAVTDALRSPAGRRLQRIRAAAKRRTIAWAGGDRFFTALYCRVGSVLFAAPVVVLSAMVIVAGGVALAATADAGHGSAFQAVSGRSAIVLFAMVLVALCFHEAGHALAVKRAGRSIVTSGFRLYLGHPAFFVDSTDLVYATPRQRVVNAVAGPWVEATIAGLAAVAVWVWPNAGVARDLRLFAGVTYVNVGLNLIPFIELDGYWLLSDVLGVPRLRAQSLAVLRHELPARVARRRTPLSRTERAMTAFAVLGLLFTGLAFFLAAQIWLPVAATLIASSWRAGNAGRIGLVLVLALLAGPLAQPVLAALRAAGRRVRSVLDDVRFRVETRWRVEAATRIAALPTLGAVDHDVLADLANRVRRQRVRAGHTVVRQGDAATSFFVVRRGQFDVVERDADGRDRVLRHIGAGESFGELALLGHRPRTASVVATHDSELFEIDAGTFQRLLAPALETPDLAPALGPALELQQLPLFRGLALDQAALLAERAERRNIGPDEAVVRQGDAADGFYVVLAGQAEVARDGTRVATLRAGDHFGETALLDGVDRTATVRTLTPSQLLYVDSDTFSALVASAFHHHRGNGANRRLGGEFG